MPYILNSTELLFHIRTKKGVEENILKGEIKTLRGLADVDIQNSIDRALQKKIIRREGTSLKPSSKIKYLR